MKRVTELFRNWGPQLAFAVFFISMLPILYCGYFNYATADDFIKSYTVHNAILNGGNLIDIIKEGIRSAAEMWGSWEGTWASNFVLALQPSIWGEHVYAVTVPLCIFYSAIGTGYFLWEILVNHLAVSQRCFWTIYWLQLVLFLQYMPYIRGGMFWYPGMAHYIMPMCLSLLMIAWMLKWEKTGKSRYFIFMLVDAAYIGGSHYQHIILVLLVLVSGWLWSFFIVRKNQKRMTFLWLPIAEILIGLYVCIISPGNLTRGGEGFGLHVRTILLMPATCVIEVLQHWKDYLDHTPLLIMYAVLLILIGKHCVKVKAGEGVYQIPIGVALLYLFLLCASTEAPGVYAAGNSAGISGGYFDVVYQTMLLAMTIGFILFGGWLRCKRSVCFSGRQKAIGMTVLLLITLVCLKPCVKRSTAYQCYDFAESGRLRDFVIQMEERIELLNDTSITDLYVPEMNDEQGPFMHLQLSEDSGNYTNQATALYYGKKSVTAVPRPVYYQEYAKKQGHAVPEEYQQN